MYSMAPGSPLSVSLINIVANPKKYEDQHIQVYGYLSDSAGSLHLFISKDSASVLDFASSVYVEDIAVDGKYISDICSGYNARLQGDLLYIQEDRNISGYYEIVNLKRISIFDEKNESTDCWKSDT
ncbi:hypothetical protein NBRC116493_32620 [Aurantivibrio infirmus]